VPRVHRLQHVERLAAPAFPDDDPVGAHPERVDEQLSDGDLPLALSTRRPGLEPDHIAVLELEARGVLDGDDPLPFGMKPESTLRWWSCPPSRPRRRPD